MVGGALNLKRALTSHLSNNTLLAILFLGFHVNASGGTRFVIKAYYCFREVFKRVPKVKIS